LRQLRHSKKHTFSIVISLVFRLVFLLGVFWIFSTFIGCALQRHLIYYPISIDLPVAEELSYRQGFEPWFTRQGSFVGWQEVVPDDAHKGRQIIILHGNAGYALHRTTYRNYLGRDWRVNILEYPGFGARDGLPSENALVDAAVEAVRDFIGRGYENVYLLGESLGTGVAAAVAAKFPDTIAGMIFVTPFTSLADVAASQFPFLPVRTILRDRYDSELHLQSYRGPLFFLIAGQDEVVPKKLGLRLYEAYDGPKKLIVLETATHNTVLSADTRDVWNRINMFFQ